VDNREQTLLMWYNDRRARDLPMFHCGFSIRIRELCSFN